MSPTYKPIAHPSPHYPGDHEKTAKDLQRIISQGAKMYPDWTVEKNPDMVSFIGDDHVGSAWPEQSRYDAQAGFGDLHHWDRTRADWKGLHGLYKEVEPALGDMAEHHDKLFGISGGKFAAAAWRYTVSSRPYNYAITPALADRHLPEMHTDHAILSSGLRHPSLALQAPVQVHMMLWGDTTRPLQEHLYKAVEGTRFTTNRFMSTSVNPHYGVPNSNHRIIFHLPKGFNKGAYVGTISSFPREGEFLMDHHQSFEFMHKEMKRDNYGIPEGGHDFHLRPVEDHNL